MCEPLQGFRLCSCFKDKPVIHHKKSRRHLKKREGQPLEKQFTWQLLRYEKSFESGEVGRVIMPSYSIGSGLSDEYVCDKLNSENCFDFDFTPQQKDNLRIWEEDERAGYLSFYFDGGLWKIGYGFDAFDDIMYSIGKGMVKLVGGMKEE